MSIVKRRLKRFLVMLLVFCLVFNQMVIPAGAAEVSKEYIYSHNEKYWEVSPYLLNDTPEYGDKFYEYARLFALDGDQEIVPAYCADWRRSIPDTNYYKRVNMEDSSYLSKSDGNHIRTILREGYWPDWDDTDLYLAESKFGGTNLTYAQALSATQIAIWYYTNDNPGMKYSWASEYSYPSRVLYKDKIKLDAKDDCDDESEAKSNIEDFAMYLINLVPTEEDIKPTIPIFANSNFAAIDGIFASNGTVNYDVTVCFSLATEINVTDNLTVTAEIGECRSSQKLGTGTEFSIVIKNVPDSVISKESLTLSISGEQDVEGFYFYEAYAADGSSARNASQNMVGWYDGKTPVSASKTVSYDFTEETISLVKMNKEQEPLSGAEFTLYATKGNETYTVKENLVTDENGEINVTGLPSGYTYYFKETTAPKGYLLPLETDNKYIVGSDGTVTVINEKPESTKVTISGTKDIVVNNLPSGENISETEFTFTLKEGTETIDTVTVKSGEDFDFKFAPITYTDEGNHTYTVSEVSGNKVNWQYDTNEYSVDVKVTEQNRALKAEVIYPNAGKSVNFTNTYTWPESVSVTLGGTKKVTGDADKTPPEFTFVLTDKATGRKTETSTTGAGEFYFEPITYNKAGTYTYTVEETVGSENGWTYSTSDPYEVVVTVTEAEGKLEANVNKTIEQVQFTNNYEYGSTTAEIEGTKKVTGDLDETPPTFTFELKDKTSGEVLKTTEVKGDGTFKFEAITYNREGTYEYIVSEKAEKNNGWTYDVNSHDVKVTVKDIGGELEASVSKKVDEVVFINSYEYGSATVEISGAKTVIGKDAPGGTVFTFTLTDEATKTVKDTKTVTNNGTFKFNTLTYTEPGTYTYTVKETALSDNHWVCDNSVYTVTVTVEDKGGYLDKTVVYTDAEGKEVSDITFTNTYAPTPVGTEISVTKEVLGTAPQEKEFYFVMKDENGNIVGEATSGSGTFTIKTPTYTESGTHVYTISEVGENNKNWQYDKNSYEVTVKVEKDGDTDNLKATVQYPDGGVKFTNTYTPDPVQATIGFTKNVTGKYAPSGQKFKFELKDSAGKVIETLEKERGYHTFTPISFSAVGEYRFTISEVVLEGVNGWTCDSTVHEVIVKVTNSNGSLISAVEYVGGERDFTNHYEAEDATATIEGIKHVMGKDADKEREYQFELKDDSSDTVVQTVSRKGEGLFSFSPIKYDETGIYTYTVSEVDESDAYWNYDKTVYTITVTVTDNNGVLNASVDKKLADVKFTNTYTPTKTTATIKGTKLTKGDDLPETETFTFELIQKDTNHVVDEATVTNSGEFKFDTITYTESGIYEYIVSEQEHTNKHWTCDETKYEVTVTVVKDGDALKATVDKTADQVKFTNTYKADGTDAVISGRKTVEGDYAPENAEFTFELREKGKTEVLRTATAKASEEFSFDKIDYSKTGVYEYVVTEKNLGLSNWTYDETEYPVVVTVTKDDATDALAADVTYPEKGIVFTNTYTPEKAKAVIGGTKLVHGDDAPENTVFTFVLSDNDGNKIEEVSCTGAKNFSFTELQYDAEGIHTYTVREVALSDTTHWNSDDTVYTVEVTVTNNNGVLGTTTTIRANDKVVNGIEFTNTYTPDPTTAVISGSKKIVGKDAPEGTEFTFELKEKGSDNVIGTAKVTDEGTFSFEKINYTKSGTYEYVVSEKKLDNKYWTCDETEQEVTVIVTRNGNALEAVVNQTAADVKFTNTYYAKPTTAVIGGTKAITGKYAPEDTQFTFVLTEAGGTGTPLEAKINGAGTFTFDAIEFKETGEYTYMISETAVANDNWQCDTKTYNVVVKVTKNADELSAEVIYPTEGVNFTNAYTPDDATIVIGGNKDVTGAYAPTDTRFTFELVDSNQKVVDTATRNGKGEFAFEELSFSDTGTYVYTVKEVALADTNHWTSDSTEYTVTIVVSESDGILTAVADKTAADVKFTNVYDADPTSAIIGGTKVVDGVDASEETEFTFVLADEAGTEIDRVTREGAGEFVFDAISYEDAGEFTYTVSEIALADTKHWTSDTTIHTVKVTVTNNNGVLETSVDKDETEVVFNNIYRADPTSAVIGGTKVVKGKDAPSDAEFTFVLKDSEGNEIDRVSRVGEGVFAFNPIDYTIGGTYTYTVVEAALADGHWVTDPANQTVTVSVVAENDVLTAVVDKQSADVKFTNTYCADPTTAIISGSKVISGENAPASEFTFQLKEGDSVIDEATLDAAGAFTFDEITYTETGVHNYTVTEVNAGGRGWTYDPAVYNVVVTVTEENSALSADVVYENGDVVFTNTYVKPEPTATNLVIEGVKKLDGIQDTDKVFKFVLEENGTEIDRTTTIGKGSFEFAGITYETEGSHVYRIYEISENAKGWTYDKTVFEVEVTVTEDQDGKLVADANYVDGEIVFTNTFTPEVSTPSDATSSNATPSNAKAIIKGVKKVRGNNAPNRTFKFVLMEGDKEIGRATTNGAGSFKFKSIKYTEPGEYNYTVHEVQAYAEGWTYDDSVFTVTVYVDDVGDNKLEAQVIYDEDEIVFTNVYEQPTEQETTSDDDEDDEEHTTRPTEPSTETPTTVPETLVVSDVLGDDDIVEYDPLGVLGAYEQIPMGLLPATGDATLLWVLGLLSSGIGLTAVNFTSKKRKKK